MYRQNFINQIPAKDFLVLKHIEELDEHELNEKELFLIHLHQNAIGQAIEMDANNIPEPLV